MGCTSTRDAVYIPNQNNQFPSLIIEETKCQLENIDTHFVPSACGYLFELNSFQQTGEQPIKLQKSAGKPDNKVIEDIKWKVINMQKGYKEGKIDEAYRILNEIQAQSRQNSLDSSTFTSQAQRQRFNTLSERIKLQNEYLNTIQSQIKSSKWQKRQEQGITIKRKKKDHNLQVLIQSQTNNQMKLMIALFGSFERSASILKFAKSSGEIEREDMLNKIGKIMFDCPLCKKQQKHFALTNFNRLGKDSSVLISYRSLFQNTPLCERFNFWHKQSENPSINICNISLKLQKQEKSTKIKLFFEFQTFFKDIADWVLYILFENMALSTLSNLLFQSSPNSSPEIHSATQCKSVFELQQHFGAALTNLQK